MWGIKKLLVYIVSRAMLNCHHSEEIIKHVVVSVTVHVIRKQSVKRKVELLQAISLIVANDLVTQQRSIWHQLSLRLYKQNCKGLLTVRGLIGLHEILCIAFPFSDSIVCEEVMYCTLRIRTFLDIQQNGRSKVSYSEVDCEVYVVKEHY